MGEQKFDLASTILDRQQVGIAVLDNNLRLLCWNQWIAEWTSIAPDKALGKTLDTLFPHLAGSEIPETIRKTIKNSRDIIWSQQTDPERLDLTETTSLYKPLQVSSLFDG